MDKFNVEVVKGKKHGTLFLRINGDAVMLPVWNTRSGEVMQENELVERIGLALQLVDGMTNEEIRIKHERSQAAVDLIVRYGSIDGAHHKQWVLDQVLRELLGADYDSFMKEVNSDPDYDDWDNGIAP